jgi:ribonuclease HI
MNRKSASGKGAPKGAILHPIGVAAGVVTSDDEKRELQLGAVDADKTYTCYVDGGCLRNGREDASAYGSFKIFQGYDNSGPILKEEKEFPIVVVATTGCPRRPTNNMAEGISINRALTCIIHMGILNAEGSQARIFTDSEILLNQILGVYRINNPQLKLIARERNSLVTRYNKESGRDFKKVFTFLKAPREMIVEILGH